MLKSSWLTALEASAVVIWLGLAAALVSQDTERGALIPIDPAALVTGESQDVWMGIYFDGQKVGYAVNSETPTVDGGVLMRHRSAFTLAGVGHIKHVITPGNPRLGKDHTQRGFCILFWSTRPTDSIPAGWICTASAIWVWRSSTARSSAMAPARTSTTAFSCPFCFPLRNPPIIAPNQPTQWRFTWTRTRSR